LRRARRALGAAGYPGRRAGRWGASRALRRYSAVAAPAGGEAALTGADSLADLSAQEAAGYAGRTGYGDDALIVCDRVVRIYAAEGVEVQALQGLDCW
jgi:hypothetical protein